MLNATLLEGQAPLGIALSGGSDSTALLVLLVEQLGAHSLRALTVNHGLREAAAQEAEQAKGLCASLGVEHDTVTLDLQDGPDLQARARDARYEALSTWACEKGMSAIALGHTQDDVAETFLMRLARGSGVDGLAQMPDAFTRNGTHFLRPLLASKRVDLQTLLRTHEITWSEDPSNSDPRFTRVQMRKAQAQLDALGMTIERLAQTAHWMRAASQVLEHAADTWIANHAWAEHGDAVFDHAALRTAPEETACRVLSRVLCGISGNPYRPRLNALNDLLHIETATTLHGCLAYKYKGNLRITQELNAITQQNSRWTITGPLEPTHHIAPLGEMGIKHCKNWRETALLPRRSLLSSPAIWYKDQLIAAPLGDPRSEWSATTPNPLHLPN